MQKKKSSKRNIIILLLIIFWPIGLILMWSEKEFTKKTRYIVTAIATLVIISFTYKSPPQKTIIIIDNEGHSTERVTENDDRMNELLLDWKNGNTFIINNSSRKLKITSVYYSSSVESNSKEPIEFIIEGNTKIDTDIYIDVNNCYFFETPPITKSTRNRVPELWWHFYFIDEFKWEDSKYLKHLNFQ